MSERSRFVWRCRRGTKELDIIFERFMASGFDALSERERALFERLLDAEDDRLQAWLLGLDRPQDEELAGLVERIANSPRR